MEIFNENYRVPIYLICVRLMKRVEEYIRQQSGNYNLSREDINNLKFHVAMNVTMKLLHKGRNIKVEDILTIDLSKVSDEFLNEQLIEVLSVYKALGGTDKVAKGPTFTKQLLDAFDSNSARGQM